MKRTSRYRVSTCLLAFLLTLLMFHPGMVPSVRAYEESEIPAGNIITGAKVIEEGGIYLIKNQTLNANSSSGIIRVETEEPVTLIFDGNNSLTTTGNSIYGPLVIGTVKDGTSTTAQVPIKKANVTIILAAGSNTTFECKSTATSSDAKTAGISVCIGSTLTIQSEEELTDPGKLRAIGGHYAAGIGTGANKQAGTIVIEGGEIYAESFDNSGVAGNGAGIGGGGGDSRNGGHSEGIIIYGTARVTAISHGNGAGIGGGGGAMNEYNGMTGPGSGGTIKIYGDAVVAAISEGRGAGIGGGGAGKNDPAIGGGASGTITISGTPIVTATSASGAGIGPGMSTAGVLGVPEDITITGGNVYAQRMDGVTVTNGFGDNLRMKEVLPPVSEGTLSTFEVFGSSKKYTYQAIADDKDETHVWLPESGGSLTVVVTDAENLPLEHTSVSVEVAATSLIDNFTTDAGGKVEKLAGAAGSYSITASRSGYQSASTTITLSGSDATVQIALAKTSSGSGGGGIPDASLTIRCVDEGGSEIYTQTLSAVHGKTETIYAPPLKGYALAQGETGSRSHRIVAGKNEVIFRYIADEMELEDLRVPTGDGRPPVSSAIREMLETEEHIRYIQGFPDGTVRPDSNISRAEAAAIFWRLILDEEKSYGIENGFDDISGGEWYAQAVNYLAKLGIITGYEDGSFRPEQAMSRAEFAAMIARFDEMEAADMTPFVDLTEQHWAHDYVISAYLKGWMSGYPTGEFRPESPITRAEVVMIVNRMLGRGIRTKDISADLYSFYPDLSTNHWAFAEMIEASVEHDYERLETGYETHTSRS